MHASRYRIGLALILLPVGLPAVSVIADDGGYRMPPKSIAGLVDAPPTPGTSFSPDRSVALISDTPNLPPIAEVAQPELRLAGIRINPRTNDRARVRYAQGFKLKDLSTGKERDVQGLPASPRLRSWSFSPDGKYVAFVHATGAALELWVLDVAEARARRLTDRPLNAAYAGPFGWMSDSRTLVAWLIPADRGSPPDDSGVPAGPVVQETTGKKAAARTYQDLLEDEHDERMFDHYATSEIALVGVDGRMQSTGIKGVIADADPSPDNRYLLVQTVHRPYSYLVPASRFPRRIEIHDRAGKQVRLIADLPLAEDIPIAFSSARKGPRSVGWRADAPAQLYWAEARDGGDPDVDVEVRDEVMTLAAPFEGDPTVLAALPQRYSSVTWGNDDVAMVSAWWWQTRNVKTWLFAPSRPGDGMRIIWDRSWQDVYSDPGSPVTVPHASGRSVMLIEPDGSIYLSGQGASPEGNRPFLDRMKLADGQTERLWRSEDPYYERFVAFVGDNTSAFITRRESKTEPPNYFVRDLKSGDMRQFTRYPHPTPELLDVKKEMIRYEREDGVKLTATLYLPPGYKEGDGPLPVLVWAYPQEFKDADAAGQVTGSPNSFVRVGWWSPLPWLTQGFAVLDDPTLPIIGEGDEEPNDTFVAQLVSGAKAAIDEVVRRGVGDRNRVAVGGHSYGAFMTANLLAHSDLFRAGIARSGAYNRTLTPFGFQSEERTYWEAPEIYFQMSPFMHADKVNEPILLIHGAADNNSGTFPMQSERYYNALKGHGAIARLVMLPHESHGYRARESVMHMLAEMNEWLERYVKNPTTPDDEQQPEPATTSS